MKNTFTVLSLVLVFMFLVISIGCNKKQDAIDSNATIKILDDKHSDIDNETIKKDDFISNTNLKNESVMYKFTPALEFFTEYKFDPISCSDLNLIDIRLEENKYINCYYAEQLFFMLEVFTENIDYVTNFCISYNNDRLQSAVLYIRNKEEYYYGLFNFPKGILKIYKSLQAEGQHSIPFYSGDSQFFIIENKRFVKEAYYDDTTNKQVRETYCGYLELYDFNTNELIYKIDKKLLHETISLSIDKIQYDEDGLSITLGNYYDSDEYVDFKLFTNNTDFRYEIYDKYSYYDD